MADNNQTGPTIGSPLEEPNLSRKELEGLPAKSLVDIIMWQRQGNEMLADKLHLSEVELSKLDAMVNQLSIDPKTGILTMGALKVLGDILIDAHVLEILKEKSFTLTVCMLDVDELRKHNAIGGHQGGDAALAEVSKRLKILYRRKSDVVAYGLIDAVATAQSIMKPNDGSFQSAGRFERGDEMIAWRFSPPVNNDIQRKQPSLESEVQRVTKGFEGATVSYPALQGLDKKQLKMLDPEERYKLESGIVTAPVSVTFACVQGPMPANRQESRRILRRADELVMVAKNARKGKAPTGSIGMCVKMTEDDLI